MEIVILGDFFPTQANEEDFVAGNIEKLLGNELSELIKQSTFSIANLEGPLTDSEEKLDKFGPNLKAKKECIRLFKDLGVDVLCLANNHILDYSLQGLHDTINQLEDAGIKYVGAGENLKEASKPLILNDGKKKIGILACAEYEFTIARSDSGGANPFEPLYFLDAISDLKKEVDYCIVLYHGGKEYYRYPAPYVQERCRRMIEKGADIVLCQHSHCIGCCEEYLSGNILYGQGDFLFHRKINEYRSTGLVVKIDLEKCNVEYIPIKMYENGIRIAQGEEKEKILAEFYERSDEIRQKQFVEMKYGEMVEKSLPLYLAWFTGSFGKLINRISPKLVVKLRSKAEKNFLINSIRCEAHRDLVINALEKELNH